MVRIKHTAAKNAQNQFECSNQHSPPCHSQKHARSSFKPISKRTKSQVAQSYSQLSKGKEKQQANPDEESFENLFFNAKVEKFYNKKFCSKELILE